MERMRQGLVERIEGQRRLYLEVGGHLGHDGHASRVLPGFRPDAKLVLLKKLSEEVTTRVIVAVHAAKVEENAPTANTGLRYVEACKNLVQEYDALFGVAALVVTRVKNEHSEALKAFCERFRPLVPAVHCHNEIANYPHDLESVMRGLDANSAIQVPSDARLILVTGVQANSGKLGTCLSQLRKEERAIYSKLELFPIWNLHPRHAINLAYEAATADIGDAVEWDPYEKDGKTTCNYNRDIEAFPVLRRIMECLLPKGDALLDGIYRSPTAMGVNYAGFAIVDESVCIEASRREIHRRLKEYESCGDEKAVARVKGIIESM